MNRHTTLTFVAALAAMFLVTAVCRTAAADALTFYVATDGNDRHSGRLPAPNAAGADGPLATLGAARDAIRRLKAAAGAQRPVRVLLRAGTYYLGETFDLGPQDSGTAECPIAYEAQPGEKVVLSGGRVISGWKPYRGRIVQCDLTALGLAKPAFKQLFYNGRRQPLARAPNVDPKHPRTGGWTYVAETFSIPGYDPADDRSWVDPYNVELKTHLKYDPAAIDPAGWSRPESAEVSIFPWQCWNNNLLAVANIDRANHLITLAGKGASYKIIRGNRFFVQNVFEELDAPGEWYLDRQAAKLYFWPPDDKLAEATVVAPVLDHVISLAGKSKHQPVEHVRLAGFSIAVCEGLAVAMHAARHCTVAKSVFANVGTEAVWLDGNSTHNCVVGNDNTIENNIMVDGLSSQVCFSNVLSEFKKTKSDMTGNRFVRNVVSYSDPAARLFAVGGWTERMMAESDYNLFHTGGHVPVIRTLPDCKPAGSFARWKRLGYEAHSLLAEPLFVDAAAGDYRLCDDSPAWKLGFKRIPIEKIGLHADPDRATWPVNEQLEIWREDPLLETTIPGDDGRWTRPG